MKSNSGDFSALQEGEDYTVENGLLVFTEAYHLKRGYCCGSGCRHCPYEGNHSQGETRVREEVLKRRR